MKALIVVLPLIFNPAGSNVHAGMRVLGPAIVCESTEGTGQPALKGQQWLSHKARTHEVHLSKRLAAQVFVEVQRALDSLSSQSSKISARNSDFAAPHAQEAPLAA